MWQAKVESGEGDRLRKISILRANHEASFKVVIAAWKDDQVFRGVFSATLRDLPFRAFRWECPPLVRGNIERAFECVALPAADLDRPADAADFAEFLTGTAESIVGFANLGRDAFLVVPRPLAASDAFAHLAAFLRTAASAQIDELWRRVGVELSGRLGDKPIWLNTAGAGVPWLHVRLDSRPKYYQYQPYKSWPQRRQA